MVETVKLNTKKYNCSGEEVIDALKGSFWYDKYLLKESLDHAFYEYQKITDGLDRVLFEPFYEKGLKLYACELLDKGVISLWKSLKKDYPLESPIGHLESRFNRFPPLIKGKPIHTLNITRIFLEYLSFLESSENWNRNLHEAIGCPKNFESKDDEKNDEKKFSHLLYKIGHTFPHIKAPQEKCVKFIESLKSVTNHLPKKYEGIITEINNFVDIREGYISKKKFFDDELNKFYMP